ncbi:MAG: lipopolysaccharide heptosyltransferase II [Gammaproteobacteria bacterium]|nr:lipopolysaccharide heptosyltransferase II [Gammaproteobacteria bacterium]
MLIVGPAWVGDMVMAHTLVQRLHKQDSSRELHMLAPPATAPVAQRMAEIGLVHTVDFAHGELALSKRRRVGQNLKSYGYERAYVLPNSWKSALVPFFAGIETRVGWHGEARYGLLNDRRKLDKHVYPLMIERFMALAECPGLDQEPGQTTAPTLRHPYPHPKLEADPNNAASLLQKLSLQQGATVAICPGAEFGAAKKWPPQHYAAVANELVARGKQVWLMGSPSDQQDCAAIVSQVPAAVNLAGKTSLLDALDLLSLTEQVLSNDSGLMHVACALGIPTLGIFGSTSAEFTPPLGEHAQVVEQQLDCRPCFQRTCPLGHLDCLQKLEPAQVIARLLM